MCSKLSGLFFVVVLLSLCSQGQTARILGFFPSPSKSHLIVYMSVIKPLIERGHDVTVVTILPLKESNPQYRHIKLNTAVFDRDIIKNAAQDKTGGFSKLLQPFTFVKDMFNKSDSVLREPEMQQLMQNESFDLVLLGYFFNNFHIGLGAVFKCPVAIIWMSQPITMLNNLIGNPVDPFYMANFFVESGDPTSFLWRLKNFIAHMLEKTMFGILNIYMATYYESHFPAAKYPSYDEMTRNVSLLLVNHHFSQGPIRPNVPALIEIGGIQIKEKADPLPKAMANFLDNAAKEGAIYFSLGSNVHSSELREDTQQAIYKVLAGLNKKSLWKFESDNVPGNSSKILYNNWFPQDDILAHPNVRLFITHGGMGGITEAIYHGVPMIAIPFMADQQKNAIEMESKGFGLVLNLQNVTENTLREAIHKVLTDPTYKNNVKSFSNIFRDRPQTAKQSAIFWIEYVLRHRGAPHMQSPLVQLNSLQVAGLDVISFLLISCYLVLKISLKCLKLLIQKVFKRSKKQKDKRE